MTAQQLRDQLLGLPPDDRVALAVELWESVAGDLPLPDWQEELVTNRLRELDAGPPAPASAWKEVRARVWAREGAGSQAPSPRLTPNGSPSSPDVD